MDGTNNEDQCWKNSRRGETAQENAEKTTGVKGADIERKENPKGAQRDREREERHC